MIRAAALLPVLALAARSSSAECPSCTLQLGFTPIVFTVAAYETTYGAKSASFDLVQGRLTVAHSGLGESFARAVDRYRVVGVPPGTPISMMARLDVEGYAETLGCGGSGCYGTFGAQISWSIYSVSRTVTARYSGRVDLIETLDYPLTVVAGEEVEFTFKIWGKNSPGHSHWEAGSARFRFDGLPAEARVESCSGYAGNTTPVRSTTWGRIKAIYR